MLSSTLDKPLTFSNAQDYICEHDSTVVMASTLPSTFSYEAGTLMNDNVHYTAEGRQEIGMQLGEEITFEPNGNMVYDIMNIIPIFIVVGLIIAVAATLYKKE